MTDPESSGRIERFSTVTEGVEPCYAQFGEQTFCFDKRPNAEMQIKLMEIARSDKRNSESLMVVRDILESTLADPDEAAVILRMTDISGAAQLMNWVVRQMSERPTTGRPDSSPSPPETTSATGSSEPESTDERSAS